MDAVNPDYLAVQLLFPNIQNPDWSVPHTGYPLLGQLYHGTTTTWLQLLLIGLTGKASVFTLRTANMLYIIGICIMIHFIYKKLKVNKFLSLATIGIVMLSPQVYSFIRTQYYIKLPGTLFLFCAFYCLLMSESQKRYSWKILISGLLCGLAFYSYFIYLFFVPAMLIICFFQSKRTGHHAGKDILLWITGFCGGSLFYIIGYFDLIITFSPIDYNSKKLIVICTAFILMILVSLFLVLVGKNYSNCKVWNKLYGCAMTFVIFFTGIVIFNIRYILSIITPLLDSLDVSGSHMNLIQRIRQTIFFGWGVLSNNFSEILMLDFTTSVFPNILILVLISVTILASLLIYKKTDANSTSSSYLIYLWILLFSFGITALAFISRMGGQHFAPIFFIMMLILGLELNIIFSSAKTNIWRYVTLFSISVLFLFCIVNTNLLDTNLKFTGGSSKFTEQINLLAYDAMEQKSLGEKELYIFPDWGFIHGFGYLTMNQVHCMGELNTDVL